MRAGVPLLLLVSLVAATATSARAQNVTAVITGGPVSFPAPTAADYNNGFVNDGTPLTYTLTLSTGAASTTTVAIHSSSANLGGGKALSDLQWRRGDLVAWNAMTTANVTVQSVQLTAGTPYSNTIFFRTLLSWTADAPATHSANLVVAISVTTP
ncbi:MAG TPA: hypothetical protein VMH88_14040 [Gemmatimonadales bacterium]|nr:hypothetical protein [Gemmatimonadales bacterium]